MPIQISFSTSIQLAHEKMVLITYDPPYDKTNKMECAPSEHSDQPGHPPSLISLRCLHEETLGP